MRDMEDIVLAILFRFHIRIVEVLNYLKFGQTLLH